MDNIDELFLFLKAVGLNSPEKLLPFVMEITDFEDNSVTQKLLNTIILSDPVYYEHYIDFKLHYEKKMQPLAEHQIILKMFNMQQARQLFQMILQHIKEAEHLSSAKGESLAEIIELFYQNDGNPLYDYVYHLRKLFELHGNEVLQDETFFESTKSVIETLFKKYYEQLPQSSQLLLLSKLKKEGFL